MFVVQATICYATNINYSTPHKTNLRKTILLLQIQKTIFFNKQKFEQYELSDRWIFYCEQVNRSSRMKPAFE